MMRALIAAPTTGAALEMKIYGRERMVKIILAHLVSAFLQWLNGKRNVKVGVETTLRGPLAHRLSCPLPAYEVKMVGSIG
jgi:hypothetical protein